MIPCHVCGKDASTGWITGFTPAPDSQKLALCPDHDTLEHRMVVSSLWQERHLAAIAAATDVARHKAAPTAFIVTILFNGGGMLSFSCASCAPTAQNTLCIDELNGARTYVPLQHVREYSVRPLHAGNEEGEGEERHLGEGTPRD